MFISPEQIVKSLNLKTGNVVADFGCGSGAYVFTASKIIGDTGKVYAIDINVNILDKINREADKLSLINIETIVSNVEEKVYLDNNICDLVILSNILSEVINVDHLINEAKRVLKKDGAILVVDWKNIEHNLIIKRHSIIEEEKVIAILSKNNLSIKKHFPAGEFHYAFLAGF